MEQKIILKLQELERDYGFRVLYACEVWDRAWGLNVKQSPYSIRFVYLRPIDWYLSVDAKSDSVSVIEKGKLDVQGWDLQATLQWLRIGYTIFVEWLTSPIVYFQNELVVKRLMDILYAFPSPGHSLDHYFDIALENYCESLMGKKEVWFKEYLYTLRPLLMARQVERGCNFPPLEFGRLLSRDTSLPKPVETEARCLLASYTSSGEQLAKEPIKGFCIEVLDTFIQQELVRLEGVKTSGVCSYRETPLDQVNTLFRDALMAYPQGHYGK